jgi:hypothetical protein
LIYLPQLISLRTFGVKDVLGYAEEKEDIVQLIRVGNRNYAPVLEMKNAA